MDAETGLIYLRARYYDPGIGRFITRDPSPATGTMTQDINRYTYAYNNPVRFVDPSGLEVGFWESMIPVLGPTRQAIEDFQGGRWGWGVFNTAMAVSDLVPVKAAGGVVVKVMRNKEVWKSGSHTWPATKAWLTESGWREFKGQEMHHWLIPQGRWGKNVPNAVKNQPWNLMGMPNAAFHRALHGGQMSAFNRVLYGTPDWFKAGIFSTFGRGINAAGDK